MNCSPLVIGSGGERCPALASLASHATFFGSQPTLAYCVRFGEMAAGCGLGWWLAHRFSVSFVDEKDESVLRGVVRFPFLNYFSRELFLGNLHDRAEKKGEQRTAGIDVPYRPRLILTPR